jgi:hypothetical protein
MEENKLNGKELQIVFPHITKTGGTSLVSKFLVSLPINKTYPSPPQLTLNNEDLSRIRGNESDYTFVHGHPGVSFVERFPIDKTLWITAIRNPIKRAVSEYIYAKYLKNNVRNQLANNIDILTFTKVAGDQNGNCQTRQLAVALGLLRDPWSRLTDRISSEVVENLKNMEFLCVTERMGESLRLLGNYFSLPDFGDFHENTVEASSEEKADCYDILARSEWSELNWVDFSLLHIANSFLNKQINLEKRSLYIRSKILGRDLFSFSSQDKNVKMCLFYGWEPQGWLSEPPSLGSEFWWAGDCPSMLIMVVPGYRVSIGFDVINTVGFDPRELQFSINNVLLYANIISANSTVKFLISIDETFFINSDDGAVELLIESPYGRSSSLIDPNSGDHRKKTFAINNINLNSIS